MRESFVIRLSRGVRKDIRRVPDSMLRLIDVRIEALATEPIPHDARILKGYLHLYRLRIGNYRVIYEVAKEIRIITIVKIGHRKDVYRLL